MEIKDEIKNNPDCVICIDNRTGRWEILKSTFTSISKELRPHVFEKYIIPNYRNHYDKNAMIEALCKLLNIKYIEIP